MLTKSSWRIAVLSLLLIFVVSSAGAQKYLEAIAQQYPAGIELPNRVGMAYVKDGIPCVIIDIDEDGKHGLVMSLIPTEKAARKARKVMQKTGENEKWFYLPKKVGKDIAKLQSDYAEELFHQTKGETFEIRNSPEAGGLATMAYYMARRDRVTTSLSGKENMQNVINFCNSNDISIETYFPIFAWAQSLGEGWYIPGINELQLYVKNLGFADIGRDYKHALKPSDIKMLQILLETSAKISSNPGLFDEVMTKNRHMYPIISSTFASSDKDGDFGGNAVLYYFPGLNCYEMSFGGGWVCAVCEVEF